MQSLTRLGLRPTLRQAKPFRRHAAVRQSSSTQYTTSTRNFKLTPTTAVLCFVPVLTGFLGVWQLQRLKWKLQLIEDVDTAMAKDPMILPNDINTSALPDFQFRRVLVKGHFLDPPILLGPRVYEGAPGVQLIQPFLRTSDDPTAKPSTILVNRGFISSTRAQAIREGREKWKPPLGHGEQDEVVIEGMLKLPEGKGSFTPDNNPSGNEWYWMDLEAMSRVAGGEAGHVQPVIVDEIFDGKQVPGMLMAQGIPVGRPPVVELRNMHATYAATWLSLSFLTSIMLGKLIMKGRPTQAKNPRLRHL
ncbi:surf-like protein [Naganishia albida]|nr:surf-like protein [Naganishia albida]